MLRVLALKTLTEIIIIMLICLFPLEIVHSQVLSEDKRVKELKDVWEGDKTVDYDKKERNELVTKKELFGTSTTDKTIAQNENDSKIMNTNYDKFQSSSEFNIIDSNNPHDANVVLGEKLWKQHCNRCHNLRSAKDFNSDQWRAIMAHMKVRACLPDELARIILEYLVYSTTPPPPLPLPTEEFKTVEYKEFSETKETKSSDEKDSNDKDKDSKELEKNSEQKTQEVKPIKEEVTEIKKETEIKVEVNKIDNSKNKEESIKSSEKKEIKTEQTEKTNTKSKTTTTKTTSQSKQKSETSLPGPPP